MRAIRVLSVVVPSALAAALVAACSTGSTTNQSGASAAPSASAHRAADTSDNSSAYESVVRNVLKSVVQITTSDGLGSGVVYDDKGDVVTNAHVVGDAKTFQVTTATSQEPLSATLVASYPPNDLAVIKVSGLKVPPAKFADSTKLAVGQEVLAMGSPLGLSSSVTNGIVSALGRTVQEPRSEGSPATSISDMVQTSAAINPGNSGGALVGMDSTVVGIPTLAASDSQEGGAAPGIGFAISSNSATRIADQIIKDGKVTSSGRAALGVTVRPVLNADYEPAGAGVVSVTSGGAAAKAGIRAGDVITRLGDVAVTDLTSLTTALAEHQPGDSVPVTFTRDGASKKVDVTLGEQK